jgi:hypothetical protein
MSSPSNAFPVRSSKIRNSNIEIPACGRQAKQIRISKIQKFLNPIEVIATDPPETLT